MDRLGNVSEALHIGIAIAIFLLNTSRILKGIELLNECLFLLRDNFTAMGKDNELVRIFYLLVYDRMFRSYILIGDHTSAIECGRKLLVLYHESGRRYLGLEGKLTTKLAELYQLQNKYEKAKELCMNALRITTENGDKETEGRCYRNLGNVFHSLGDFEKAKEYFQKALKIRIEIGDKSGEATDCGNLGTVFASLGEYQKAKEYYRKALKIRIEMGDKKGNATTYGNLGAVFQNSGEYDKAEEYLQEALKIHIEIGDKEGEGADYGNLGTVFQFLGEYKKAEEYHQKALNIHIETGNKSGEATYYGNLGSVFQCLSKYDKAEEYHRKALNIHIEIEDKHGEAVAYANLGTVFESLGEHDQAEQHLQKALKIQIEIGDKYGEATSCANLGNVFQSLGEYGKADEYLQKAVKIQIQIGDRLGEATAYGSLGRVFDALGEYDKAIEYLQKALEIKIKIGDRKGEGDVYGNLGPVFRSLGEYEKAEEYIQKASKIRIEIGDKSGEAADYGNLAAVFQSLGEYIKAEKYLLKALKIHLEIGDKKGEAADYGKLGTCIFLYTGDYSMAKDYYEKSLSLAREIRFNELQFFCHLQLASLTIDSRGNVPDVVSSLLESIQKSEEMRAFLKDNDDFQISFLDTHVSPYKLLGGLFSAIGKFNEALYITELARARALADMMSAQYSLEQEMSINKQSWVGIERMMTTEIDSACLYISYDGGQMSLWIIKANKPLIFRERDVNDLFSSNGARRTVDEVFGDISLRNLPTQEHCEDRSLFPSNAGCLAPYRNVEDEDEDEDQYLEPPSLTQCYRMIIDAVADLLDKPEIIIVPEGSIYKVPFAALKDENEKYLSESFRIRIAPSLTTLKLIQDSPADYHSQTGALIVGDPEVGVVIHKGSSSLIRPLPCAREEAEMIGRLLGVQALTGEQATKQAVLRDIHSVSLIHFAAHGDAERGEIALAPPRPFNGTPKEEDYLLRMAEIAQVRLRAKLVVLSCCHSGKGQIRSEGVVGIARAFLGSGARSVLVALWAIEDEATMKFMSRFYEHLVRGESASESLHQAMKWMRSNGFFHVEEWAPFMLIGDNVTFDFGK